MDDRHLRSILLNLQYRLSDSDRDRLHFYLKNDVPRSLGDDSTLSGTLRLMQSLFDQEKISKNDFTLLIDAFKQIRCVDAVNLLKEHQRRMLLSGLNQSTQSLASMMPSLIEEFMNDYDDDQLPTNNLLLTEVNRTNTNNNIIDSNNVNISIDTSRKQGFCMEVFTKKSFLLPSILFISTSVILIIVLIGGIYELKRLKSDLQTKQNFIVERQNQTNRTMIKSHDQLSNKSKTIEQLNKTLTESRSETIQTVKQCNNRLAEKNTTIEELNKTLIELKKERKTNLIKAGRKFGGDGGGEFDDSLLPSFTSFHHVTGIIFSDIESFGACEFIYTSSDSNQSRIESKVHGNNAIKMNSTYKYYLDNTERIDRVQVRSVDQDLILAQRVDGLQVQSANGNFIVNGEKRWPVITKIITGLRFVTTKGRRIPPGIDLTGDDVESEYFSGYTLGYVTGKSGRLIDQLQFFWYRI